MILLISIISLVACVLLRSLFLQNRSEDEDFVSACFYLYPCRVYSSPVGWNDFDVRWPSNSRNNTKIRNECTGALKYRLTRFLPWWLGKRDIKWRTVKYRDPTAPPIRIRTVVSSRYSRCYNLRLGMRNENMGGGRRCWEMIIKGYSMLAWYL